MESPLADLAGWHLTSQCRGCGIGNAAVYSPPLGAAWKGLVVADILTRLRRRRCRGLPPSVTIADGMLGMGRAEPVIEIILRTYSARTSESAL